MRVTSLCEMIISNSFKIKMGKAYKGPQGDTLPGAESQVKGRLPLIASNRLFVTFEAEIKVA